MKIGLVYFSGTGSTRFVAKVFERELSCRGENVQLQDLRHSVPYELEKYDLLIICFVVHASNAPHPVINWARDLSAISKIPTAIISVSAGGEMFPKQGLPCLS